MFRPVARIDRGERHWPRKGVWGCATLKTPFSRLSCSLQGSHFKQKSLFTRPFLRKFWNFSLYSLNFCPNFSSQAPNLEIFSSQAPKFGNLQFTSPKFGIFSLQALFFRGKYQLASPNFGNPGRTPLPEKWLSAPLGDWWAVRDPQMWTFSDQSLILPQKPCFWPILWLKVDILADVRGSGVTGAPDFWPGKFCLPTGKREARKKEKM